jgi:hypothetical protein
MSLESEDIQAMRKAVEDAIVLLKSVTKQEGVSVKAAAIIAVELYRERRGRTHKR